MMDALHDGWRSLRRSPGFALLVVGILAVGIGLNAAVLAVVDSVLLRPLGYHDADRIVAIQTRMIDPDHVNTRVGGGDYVDMSQSVHGIESAAYYNNWNGVVQTHGHALMAPLAYVSPRFGQVLGVEPAAGRLFSQQQSSSTGPEALVSAGFAREQFGSVTAALGQPLRGEAGLYTIVGVLPDAFRFPGETRVWFEQPATPANLNRTAYNDRVVAKRKAGVSQGALNAELATFSKHLQQSYVEDSHKALEAIPLQQQIVGNVQGTLRLLLAAVAVVLLIVCANITHLQLVRATRQVREIAVRGALGASRSRLAARAIVEAGLLSIDGCCAAVLLASPLLRVVVHLAPAHLPRLREIHLSLPVLAASLLISFAVMALTALLPILRSWRVDASVLLRQDSTRGLESRGAVRLRGAIVVTQMALTLVLSAAAVLLARQLTAEAREDLGFNMERLYTLDANSIDSTPVLSADAAKDPAGKAAAEKAQEAASALSLVHLQSGLDTLRAISGVQAAEAMQGSPLGFGGSDVGYAIQGKQVFAAPYNHLPNADVRPVTPGALALLHVPLLRGRGLNDGDTKDKPPVVLINQALGSEQFHGEDPVGKRIQCGFDSEGVWWTIAGVVGDVKNVPGAPAAPTFYVPVAQHPSVASSMQLLVRTAPGSNLSEEALRQRLSAAQPGTALTATSMAHNLSEVERDLRFRTLLFQTFAAVSVLLAMLGMYGATAYTVAQRRFEFGLRMALGATRKQVLFGVLRRSFLLASFGIGLGVALYAAFLRVFAAMVGKLPSDLVSLTTAAGIVFLLASLAATIPARRASNVDPMHALRTE